ncbi:MAG TPA: hypothetical protein VK787_09055 [Puia sp.]|jgi:hypothetical protein|nr:hypothetical protein [Puia sp.]
MKRLPIALLLCISIYLSAQNNFTAGYIVKTDGDTLHGYLQEELRNQLVFQIQFKTDNSNSSFQTFTTNDVKAFRYETGDHYKKITFKNTLPDSGYIETVFAMELVEGAYNLYSYILKEETYFITQGNGASYFLYNTTYNANGAILIDGNYISRLGVLAAACPNKFFNTEQLNYAEKDISKYIFDLNNCLSPNTASINHYQKPKTTSQIVVFAGGMILGKNKNQITADAAMRLMYPQLSKDLFVIICIHYSHSNRPQNVLDVIYLFEDEVICVPLTLQYNFTIGPVHPYLSGGFAAAHLTEKNTPALYYVASKIPPQNRFGISVIAAAGVEGNITNNLIIKAEWRYEFFLQYPVVGIAYSF